jgi:mono/diheme cytochrome c family protein
MKFGVIIALGLALVSCLACGSARRSEPLVGAPALSLQEQHGQVLFHKFCHQCHPFGEAGLGPALNSNIAPMAAFRLQVRSGLGAMPAFSDEIIPDRDLDQLLAYVDAVREHGDD